MKHSQHSSFKPVLRFSPRPPISFPSGRGCKRLRSDSVFRCDAVMATKIGERIRISPSTPLSWSGGSGSPSSVVRGAEGCEASLIRFNSSFADSRSKQPDISSLYLIALITFMVLFCQADKDLKPWIVKDDDQSQKMWRINQRIIKLVDELMRNHDRSESLVVLASASDLLIRATDGMLLDGEACTLPQLELLEATARAVRPVLEWGESGMAVGDGFSNLLKKRLQDIIRSLQDISADHRGP